MKSTLNKAKDIPEPQFPLLAENMRNLGQVVLFTAGETGTLLVVGKVKYFPIGHHQNSWVPISNKDCWKILSSGSTITLEQE